MADGGGWATFAAAGPAAVGEAAGRNRRRGAAVEMDALAERGRKPRFRDGVIVEVRKAGEIKESVTVKSVKAAGDGSARTTTGDRRLAPLEACVALRHRSLRGLKVEELNQCAAVIANPGFDLGERAACAGAAPGEALAEAKARSALSLIARSARDVFGTIKAASAYLEDDNFDDMGMTAEALVAGGRGTAVIARLDELRYGPQG